MALLDISPMRLALLLALHARGGSATTRELRDDTGGKTVTVHRHLADLEAAGMVTRTEQSGPRHPPLLWTVQVESVRHELDQLRREFE